MLFDAKTPQRSARDEQFILVPASVPAAPAVQSTAGCIEGTSQCTVLRTGAGDMTINYNKPFARKPVIAANALHATAKLFVVIVSSSATAVRLAVFTDAGVATDPSELHVSARGFDTASQL